LSALSRADNHPPVSLTLTHAVAFDESTGELRRYDLAAAGEHADLPYDAFGYDPNADGVSE
jgi:hypothetical protein